MTLQELTNSVTTLLTRVGNNRVSAAEVLEAVLKVIAYFASEIADIIPEWESTANFKLDGTGDGKFCTWADTNGKKRIFETKVDNNTNHQPPTDPLVTENDYWKEVSASASAAIPEWAAGVFGPGLIIVFHNHSVDGRGLYVLLDPVRPFNSTNIETEITAGKWERIGAAGGSFVPTTRTVNGHALSADVTVTKGDVGLGNVDNTSDVNKPVSTAQQAALDQKLDIVDYNDRYLGKYTTLVALQTAHPTASPGDYAQVDAGAGSDVENYNWDAEDGWIEGNPGSNATTTDELPEGSTNLYFTAARVRATILTGLDLATNAVISATDTVLGALGKIQTQISNIFATTPETITGAISNKAVTPAGLHSKVVGTQDLYIPGGAFTPRASNGCSQITIYENATSKINLDVLYFDSSVQQFAQFKMVLPRNWNNGTITAKFHWMATSGTGSAVWGISGTSLSDGDALTTAFGTRQSVTDAIGATDTRRATDYTAAVTISGAPADGDLIVFQIDRDPTDAADNLNALAALIGVTLTLTTDAATSS
jgi:hypothetical protein